MPANCALDISVIEKRIRDTSAWLEKHGGSCISEQKHLDEGSQERIYWHYGYLIALKDMLHFLTGERSTNQKSHIQDKTSSHSSV